jgi:hypothetical protein
VPADARALIAKIQALPPERVAEVEEFVDFLRLREQQRTIVRAVAAASAPALAAIGAIRTTTPTDDPRRSPEGAASCDDGAAR